MFLSQRPNNDPAPFHKKDNGIRSDTNVHSYGRWEFDPRPEFTQTRDPFPWLLPDGSRHNKSSANYLVPEVDCYAMGAVGEIPGVRWAPRHEEFDTPVNAILSDYRSYHKGPESAVRWLRDREWIDYPAEDHARRVLSKLVAVYS